MGGAASIEALATGALEPVPDDDREEELLALDFPETPSEASGGARYDDLLRLSRLPSFYSFDYFCMIFVEERLYIPLQYRYLVLLCHHLKGTTIQDKFA